MLGKPQIVLFGISGAWPGIEPGISRKLRTAILLFTTTTTTTTSTAITTTTSTITTTTNNDREQC
jgi:hypothetical protein